jgi:hypothetical protein
MNIELPLKNAANWRSGSRQVRTYAELQRQLHLDLLAQHPEWIDADGNSPTCDSYDRRLSELISSFQLATRESIAQPI